MMESHTILRMPDVVKGCVLFAIGCRRYEMVKLIMAMTRSHRPRSTEGLLCILLLAI